MGDVVTVTCLKPLRFVLFGETYVTCQSTAGWSKQPVCKQCGKCLFRVCTQAMFTGDFDIDSKVTLNLIIMIDRAKIQ